MNSQDKYGKAVVLLMGYGSPDRLSDIREYLSGIYEGRPVPDYAIAENLAKYSMFGGSSPSNRILGELREKLETEISGRFTVLLAFKHWKPWISDSYRMLNGTAVESITGIPLFPFPSKNVEMSYRSEFEKMNSEHGLSGKSSFVNGFSKNVKFRYLWKSLIERTGREGNSKTHFLFSAHSLPNSHTEADYADSFRDSVEAVAADLGLLNYSFGFQSQGRYGTGWLQPRIEDSVASIGRGITQVVAVPIGFCYDHLEILYDLDYIVGNMIRNMGVAYSRTELPNHSKEMLELLKEIVLSEVKSN